MVGGETCSGWVDACAATKVEMRLRINTVKEACFVDMVAEVEIESMSPLDTTPRWCSGGEKGERCVSLGHI